VEELWCLAQLIPILLANELDFAMFVMALCAGAPTEFWHMNRGIHPNNELALELEFSTGASVEHAWIYF
jgi:hypothetical protein